MEDIFGKLVIPKTISKLSRAKKYLIENSVPDISGNIANKSIFKQAVLIVARDKKDPLYDEYKSLKAKKVSLFKQLSLKYEKAANVKLEQFKKLKELKEKDSLNESSLFEVFIHNQINILKESEEFIEKNTNSENIVDSVKENCLYHDAVLLVSRNLSDNLYDEYTKACQDLREVKRKLDVKYGSSAQKLIEDYLEFSKEHPTL